MKLIIIILILSLVITPIAYGASLPQPILIKVDPSIEGLEVLIENVNRNVTKTFYTNQYGEIAIDAYENLGFTKNTDIIRVTIPSCDCVGEKEMGGSLRFDFSVEEYPLGDYTLEQLLIGILSASTFTGVMLYVKKGKIKLNKKNLDKVIDAMPNGTGVRITKSYSGQGSIKHWHRSPKSYHDLNNRHRGNYDHKGEEELFPEFNN